MIAVGKPLVSFVIPVFNAQLHITSCLNSINHLLFRQVEYEVLIIDNGSTDKTHQIVRDLGYEFEVRLNVNVSALRNHGVAMAKGDYVAFVDSDVELTPYWLQNGIAGFKDSKVVAIGCFPGVPKDATWVQRTWDLHQRGRYPNVKPTAVQWLPSMNLIVRRKDFLAISGFNEKLKTAEDVDLCYRLGKRGIILCNPAMKAVHLGEAEDLRSFWRKETWRGLGNLRGVLSHGLRKDEVPSLGYPLYILFCFLIISLSCILGLWRSQVMLIPLNLSLLILPAMALAINTARLARQPSAILELFLLYFVYGFARAYSMVKASLYIKRQSCS